MKYIKVLGLAAVAAAALMAFVGASTASATVLCKTTPVNGECATSWAYPANTHIHAVSTTTVKLDTSFKTVECTGSTITGDTSNEGGPEESVTGPEGTLTFTGCNCEVVVVKAGTIAVQAIGHTHNGTLISNGAKTTVNCSTIFGNVHCIYVTANDSLGDITASATPTSPAIFHSNAVIRKEPTNGLCSEQSTWTATYEITEPKPLYVATKTGDV